METVFKTSSTNARVNLLRLLVATCGLFVNFWFYWSYIHHIFVTLFSAMAGNLLINIISTKIFQKALFCPSSAQLTMHQKFTNLWSPKLFFMLPATVHRQYIIMEMYLILTKFEKPAALVWKNNLDFLDKKKYSDRHYNLNTSQCLPHNKLCSWKFHACAYL